MGLAAGAFSVGGINRLHLPIAPVTRLAGASLAPWPLRGPRLQVKPLLGNKTNIEGVPSVRFQLEPARVDWWFWFVTLALIVAAMAGWPGGYLFTIGLSALQIVYFSVRRKSITAFDVQVRIVYFVVTLTGFSSNVRLPVYAVLLLGTAMVVFCNRCGIALVLKVMPWNKKKVLCSLDQA